MDCSIVNFKNKKMSYIIKQISILCLLTLPYGYLNPIQSKILKRPVEVPIVETFDTVTLTTYTTAIAQTDSTPLITASGFKLDSINPKRHRVIAISRDLKKRYKFGQRVKIENAGRYNGVYVIRDLMHPRWKNKIDILINPDDNHTKLKGVKLSKV
jgi:3D (Asp-Asp-Asp) domain-containing protein